MNNSSLLELRHVSKRFKVADNGVARLSNFFSAREPAKTVYAVNDVSLTIFRGEIVGLVGESGCGKSTLGRMVVGLHSLSEGERFWKGEKLEGLDPVSRRRKQLAMQLIFQDPASSLNPRMRVEDIVGEAPVIHGLVPVLEKRNYVAKLLHSVGLNADALRRYPHQFSGGQCARISIARALSVKPELLVCDEAVAALDVSIQAQVLNLFLHLRSELALTYLFISHDLSVVRHIADRVMIMYLGRIIESAPTDGVFSNPNHPYTQALLAAVPRLEAKKVVFAAVKGEIPSPFYPPPGCHFHPRCPHVMERCKIDMPMLREVAPMHFSACHLNY